MVTERAELQITAGQEAAFESAAAQALSLVEGADGAGAVTLLRGVVQCDSVDAHAAFTKTEPFGQFGALVRPFFAAAPSVAHFAAVQVAA